MNNEQKNEDRNENQGTTSEAGRDFNGIKHKTAFPRRTSVLLLCALLLLSAVVALIAIRSTSASQLKWKLDPVQCLITVKNTERLVPKGQTLTCAAEFFLPDDQLLSRGIGQRGTDTSLTISYTGFEWPDQCCLRLVLLDEQRQPLRTVLSCDLTVAQPTCTGIGYITTGAEQEIIAVLPARGHTFSEPVVEQPTNSVDCGTSTCHCLECGDIEVTPIYPACDIARLCLSGDLTGIGKKSEVPVTVSFTGAGVTVDCYGSLKYQGHTSLIYDKKNYTLKLYQDESHTEKNKLTLFDWQKEHKYILKANYIDSSSCRNLVCADIWSEMVACRAGHEPRLDDCSNYGATDGFPVAVYLNDSFHGLYTFTLHRDDDLFNMEDGQEDAILVTNTAQTDAAFFKATATFDERCDWEVEYSGLEDTGWAEEKLNDLIEFVCTASEEAFRENLGQYLDVDSALDYLIAVYTLGLTNSGAKNITLATYDNGTLFFSLCDMEDAFGLSADGTQVYLPSEYLPVCCGGTWDSATGSLLWDRLLQQFLPELCARYTVLRQDILTTDHISQAVSAFLNPISGEFLDAEQQLYPTKPQLAETPEEQISTYVAQRLALLDEMFLLKNS